VRNGRIFICLASCRAEHGGLRRIIPLTQFAWVQCDHALAYLPGPPFTIVGSHNGAQRDGRSILAKDARRKGFSYSRGHRQAGTSIDLQGRGAPVGWRMSNAGDECHLAQYG
jgi:hypothetical protein